MVDGKVKYTKLVNDKCESLWFQRIMSGFQNRMEYTWKPNMDISIRLLLIVLAKAEENIRDVEHDRDEYIWIIFVTYVAVSYVLSLRGNEGFILDFSGLNEFLSRNNDSYFIVCLLGKIKGENVDRRHLIPCSNVTISGI